MSPQQSFLRRVDLASPRQRLLLILTAWTLQVHLQRSAARESAGPVAYVGQLFTRLGWRWECASVRDTSRSRTRGRSRSRSRSGRRQRKQKKERRKQKRRRAGSSSSSSLLSYSGGEDSGGAGGSDSGSEGVSGGSGLNSASRRREALIRFWLPGNEVALEAAADSAIEGAVDWACRQWVRALL